MLGISTWSSGRRPLLWIGEKCNGCGICIENCPVEYVSQFERGLGVRKAIDILYPDSVPNKPVIHREHCRYFLGWELQAM